MVTSSCRVSLAVWDQGLTRTGLGGPDTRITYDDLHTALTGSPEALSVHLELIERDIEVDGYSVRIHCHCLTVDANGRVHPSRTEGFAEPRRLQPPTADKIMRQALNSPAF